MFHNSVTVRHWTGKAVVDTGSTSALLSEPVWNTTKTLGDKLIPWNGKPLYLAD